MINQLKLENGEEIWQVLAFPVLKIPYLSNLNQIIMILEVLDLLQQSIMVINPYLISISNEYCLLKTLNSKYNLNSISLL